ncbi:Bifunctional inhibitor/lipid-transfer protein/seed storage 2S albumin protein [Dioscorea alata]|uniref:Bifunctional inhibitor/lipid-transfer protein/seed storage 2S albumin protein n=1 Tax=Dioscorea alata TaxID=55571 RepID=A0ACB7UAE7_DIOAL|nr:Bifunctional inhibitor/lipid-transfer protein/seed storage 2S albumin protein [Dioscorea alata]
MPASFFGATLVSTLATMEEDEKECADQLQNLASCIPYVSGIAPKPTPQCCEDTEKVRSQQPKCLCVLIKESTDPSLGLPINTTLALHMPKACNSDAKVSNCPSILKLSPDSPDAKIFREAGDDASTNTNTTSSGTTSSSSGSKVAPANNEARLESSVGVVCLVMSTICMMFM